MDLLEKDALHTEELQVEIEEAIGLLPAALAVEGEVAHAEYEVEDVVGDEEARTHRERGHRDRKIWLRESSRSVRKN